MPEDSLSQGKDRRRHRRYPFHAPVIVVASGQVETAFARDLGAGGILVRAPKAPEIGARIEVEFEVGRRRFAMWGVVVRHETGVEAEGQKGFALRFEVSKEDEERLRHALLEHP